MAAAKPRGRSDAQMPRGFHPTSAHTGLGIGHIGNDALAVFQKRTALVGEGDAACGADQQLHAQALFQPVEAPAHDGGRHAFGMGCSGQAATGGDRDKGFELFEFVHG